MADNVVEEGCRTVEFHAVDHLRGLTGVLERDTQVRAARAGALCGLKMCGSVANLDYIQSAFIAWSNASLAVGMSNPEKPADASRSITHHFAGVVEQGIAGVCRWAGKSEEVQTSKLNFVAVHSDPECLAV